MFFWSERLKLTRASVFLIPSPLLLGADSSIDVGITAAGRVIRVGCLNGTMEGMEELTGVTGGVKEDTTAATLLLLLLLLPKKSLREVIRTDESLYTYLPALLFFIKVNCSACNALISISNLLISTSVSFNTSSSSKYMAFRFASMAARSFLSRRIDFRLKYSYFKRYKNIDINP